ncbi:uncharacterized protein LOC128132971 [Lactuca sativa]|uniref:uncharacterized protein LOC128132971 n=1 Tax=Lactuca sativa TaxID=4236 RepID=UPI0022B03B9C|nr:uncharacterized protein LOC128132971 [Lactuca sativa]
MGSFNLNSMTSFSHLLGSSTKIPMLIPKYYDQWADRMQDYLNGLDEDLWNCISGEINPLATVQSIGVSSSSSEKPFNTKNKSSDSKGNFENKNRADEKLKEVKKDSKSEMEKMEKMLKEKLEEVKLKAKNLSLVAHGETESDGTYQIWSSGSDDEEMKNPSHGAMFAKIEEDSDEEQTYEVRGQCFVSKSTDKSPMTTKIHEAYDKYANPSMNGSPSSKESNITVKAWKPVTKAKSDISKTQHAKGNISENLKTIKTHISDPLNENVKFVGSFKTRVYDWVLCDEQYDNKWYIDSGCSRHMNGKKENLRDFRSLENGGVVKFDQAIDAEKNAKDNQQSENSKLDNDSISCSNQNTNVISGGPMEGEHLDSNSFVEREHSYEADVMSTNVDVEGEPIIEAEQIHEDEPIFEEEPILEGEPILEKDPILEEEHFDDAEDACSINGSENDAMFEDAPLDFDPDYPPLEKWTRNHPKEQILGDPQAGVLTRAQLHARNEHTRNPRGLSVTNSN